MDGFKSIEIQKYRGVNHLAIEDLSRVNIFLGHNNSGKSTILESLMLLMGMSNPDIVQRVNSFRTRNLFSNFNDVRYIFHNLDFSQAPEIQAQQFDGISRDLKMNLTYIFDEKENLAQPQIPTSETKVFLNTLEMNFSISSEKETKSYRSSVTFHQGAVTRKTIAEGYLEKNSASFLSADLMANNTANDLAELIKRKKKDVVLERLVKFDDRINAIETIGNEIFIGFEGMGELLPLGMTGDGLRRYLSIVASSANPTNNIILIDEIDNGLHYSAYKKLWESIFALATDTNKQVFVTTHSQETLYQLYQMLEENAQYQESFRLYTTEQTLKKDHKLINTIMKHSRMLVKTRSNLEVLCYERPFLIIVEGIIFFTKFMN